VWNRSVAEAPEAAAVACSAAVSKVVIVLLLLSFWAVYRPVR